MPAPGARRDRRPSCWPGLRRSSVRRVKWRVARTCVVVGVVACAIVFSSAAGAASTVALKRASPPGGGYSVELPNTWRFANASYPSDHATHLWFDPANALRKMLVVLSGCVGCAEKNGQPDPSAGVPTNAVHVVRLNPSEDAFQNFTDDDPWTANGISIVIRQGGRIDGYVSVELWLPPDQHAIATTILNSFRLNLSELLR